MSAVVPHKRGGKASPVRSMADFHMIYGTLRKYGLVREAFMWVLGCNCALRISDLRMLKSSEIQRVTNPQTGVAEGYYEPKELKTSKIKVLRINQVGMSAVDALISFHPDAEYLFQSTSNNVKEAKPVTTSYVDRKLKMVREDLGLAYRLSSHSMRKTFGYHYYMNAKDKAAALNVLMKLYNHSSPLITAEYIGLTQDLVNEAYSSNLIGADIDMDFELGGKDLILG